MLEFEKWLDGLNQQQSSHTPQSLISRLNSQEIGVNDSASNVGEVLETIVTKPVYNIDDPTMFVNIIREKGVLVVGIMDWNQTFVIFNDVILTVDPNLIYYFV